MPGLLYAADAVDTGVAKSATKTVKGSPWSQFNDPVLNQLVNDALDGNLGIHAAQERIRQAEAQAQSSLAPLHPSVWAEGAYNLNSYDSKMTGMGDLSAMTGGREFPNYRQSASASLLARYTVDITGRYTKARRASLKEVSAVHEDVQAQAMTIASLVVQAYYDVAAAQMRVALIEKQVQNYETLLKLVMTQFNVGSATALDVLQQRSQLQSKKAQLPLAQSIIESGKLQLKALLGDPHRTLPAIPAALPTLSKKSTPRPGMSTEEMIAARPELRAAEIRIDALEDQKSSTKRALLPSLGLLGQVGYQWSRFQNNNHGENWSIGATLTVPIYMGGSNRAALHQTEAAQRSARYSLQNSILETQTRILTAIENEKAQQQYLLALEEQTKAAEQTVKEATKRYVAGLSNYLNVLNANDVLQLNQLSLLQAQRNLLNAKIAVLEAMGGKWTQKLVTDE